MSRMTRTAASRIQSATAKANDGVVAAGSFAARAMSAAYRNEPMTDLFRHASTRVKDTAREDRIGCPCSCTLL